MSQVSGAAATGNAHTQEGATSLDDSLKEPGASVAIDLPPSPCPDDMDKNRNMEENTDEDIADENDPNGTNNQDCEVKMQDEEEGKDQAITDSIKKKLKRKKSLKVNTAVWLLTVRKVSYGEIFLHYFRVTQWKRRKQRSKQNKQQKQSCVLDQGKKKDRKSVV